MTAAAPERTPATPKGKIPAPAQAVASAQGLLAEFLVLEMANSERPVQADELATAFFGLLSRSRQLLDCADTTEVPVGGATPDPDKTASIRTFSVRLVQLPDGRQLVEARDHGAEIACRLVGQVR